MELGTVTDDEGNTLEYKLYQGHVFPKLVRGNVRDQLYQTAKLQCRPDDVLLCTYPKTGLHWTYNIIHMLVSEAATYVGSPKYLEFDDIGDIDTMPSRRVYATHFEVCHLPDAVKNGTGKVINIVRNPKDVAVSYFCFLTSLNSTVYSGNFSGFLQFFLKEDFLFGNWFGALKQWLDTKKTYPLMKTLTLHYEDLQRNTLQNIYTLANFLEIPADENFLRQVELNVEFSKMKIDHENKSLGSETFKDISKHGVLPIYRKGDIGDWKRWFTQAQSEEFDRVYNEKMEGYDIDFVYE
ncbi:sulfotransferase family cytosolic 1B member 1-like [Pecten maximus]|uniref:sulfotransferase family cytosolic 1B member 1-like n=1 Tax=Pecten maximus TaxID=6579 RepID=UPI001459024A|nr:sulfotransferase family cytosolic 1B member 1-like [Pecten maximus]